MKFITALLALFLFGLLGLLAHAQPIGGNTTVRKTTAKTVATMPLMFRESDKGEREYTKSARDPYEKALHKVFEDLGIKQIDQATVNAAWRDLKGYPFETSEFALPDAEDLVELGKRLNVDYVLVSRCFWRVRTVYAPFAKTKANATVDLLLVNVRESRFEIKKNGVLADSEDKLSAEKGAAILLLSVFIGVVGGPKTPHEERSGVIALARAINEWYEQQVGTSKIKIGG